MYMTIDLEEFEKLDKYAKILTIYSKLDQEHDPLKRLHLQQLKIDAEDTDE